MPNKGHIYTVTYVKAKRGHELENNEEAKERLRRRIKQMETKQLLSPKIILKS